MKKVIVFLCLFVILLGSVYGICHYSFYQDSNYQEVIVLTKEVKPNTMITQADITLKRVFKDDIYAAYVTKVEEVIGYYTDYYQCLKPNEMIELSRIKSLEEMKDSIHYELDLNQTTFSVQVDLLKSGGNSFVKHQKVDVYGAIKPLQQDPLVDVVLHNVRILSVLDRNGQMVDQTQGLPAIINLAVDQRYIGLLSKLQKMGVLELYAQGINQEKSESSLAEHSLILDYLKINN